MTITELVASASLDQRALTLGSEPAGSVGPAQTVTVTNNGTTTLDIAGVLPSGADPSDYLIVDGCLAPVQPNASCTIGVRFAPQAPGASSATLTLVSNSPDAPAIDVSGTGTAPASGETGPTGPKDASGAAGSTGPKDASGATGSTAPIGATAAHGPAGAIGATGARRPARPAGKVVCGVTFAARSVCTLEFVPGTSPVAARSRVRFVVTRGRHAVRSGALRLATGRKIIRRGLGRLPRARYTLVLTSGRGQRRRTVLRLAFRVR